MNKLLKFLPTARDMGHMNKIKYNKVLKDGELFDINQLIQRKRIEMKYRYAIQA